MKFKNKIYFIIIIIILIRKYWSLINTIKIICLQLNNINIHSKYIFDVIQENNSLKIIKHQYFVFVITDVITKTINS